MGKGDKKSKRGKIAMGTFGKSRPTQKLKAKKSSAKATKAKKKTKK
jgi:30S ribosomal protein S31